MLSLTLPLGLIEPDGEMLGDTECDSDSEKLGLMLGEML